MARPPDDDSARTALRHRLKRAEGQLRGIQRLLDDEAPVTDVAVQLAAVRRALDSAYLKLTLDVLQQSLQARLAPDARRAADLAEVLAQVQTLLGKVR
jgi:DNA-binding FrmR family transcriptional regulator